MFERILALVAKVGAFLRKDALDRDFDAELSSHLEMATDDLIASGLTPSEARRRARLRLGSVDALRESHRETRGLPLMDTLLPGAPGSGHSCGRQSHRSPDRGIRAGAAR